MFDSLLQYLIIRVSSQKILAHRYLFGRHFASLSAEILRKFTVVINPQKSVKTRCGMC